MEKKTLTKHDLIESVFTRMGVTRLESYSVLGPFVIVGDEN